MLSVACSPLDPPHTQPPPQITPPSIPPVLNTMSSSASTFSMDSHNSLATNVSFETVLYDTLPKTTPANLVKLRETCKKTLLAPGNFVTASSVSSRNRHLSPWVVQAFTQLTEEGLGSLKKQKIEG